MNDLRISVTDRISVQDFLGVFADVIKFVAKTFQIISENIKNWQRAHLAMSVNAPPVSSFSVSLKKAVFR
jgi:hypothetical protein